MLTIRGFIAAGLLLSGLLAMANPSIDLTRMTVTDLTYAVSTKTLYWPNSPMTFSLTRIAHGKVAGGYFYAANAFCTPEHGGTHLDAPLHFAEDGPSVSELPLSQLLSEAVVIDIRDKTQVDRDYQLQYSDIERFEKQHGVIPTGSYVLLLTGWGKFWPDRKAYLGDDRPQATDQLHFPGFSEAAAQALIDFRQVKALGIDTASLDHGPSRDFRVHRLAAHHGVLGIENIANLDQLPARGAFVIALPMKIEAGTGAPLRIIAVY